MYVAALDPGSRDHLTNWFYAYRFLAAGYLIFIAMLFDAIDGRLARFARHTTDFGGQLDSLADVISFGCAPAFIALQLFHSANPLLPAFLGRLMWSIAALYMSCAAIRLARFNVSNEHGEQYHFSFLGLPSPGAGAAVAGLILMQQDIAEHAVAHNWIFAEHLATAALWTLPVVVLVCGLLMVSAIRFPHFVNRYLRGRRSITRLLTILILVFMMVTLNRYTLGIGSIGYVIFGLAGSSFVRFRPRAQK
jgi:CDP-diacylglycerol--serine O-phosphatidyltransferase